MSDADLQRQVVEGDVLSPGRVNAVWRALRRVLVEIAAGCLYGLQGLWHYRWDVAWIVACIAFATYWLTAWAYLIMDRTGY